MDKKLRGLFISVAKGYCLLLFLLLLLLLVLVPRIEQSHDFA